MNIDDRIEALEAENERLRDRIFILESDLGHQFRTPIEWCLTGQESRIFGVLMAREVATKSNIMNALYGGMDEAEIKIVDVFMCKIRAKLKRFGIAIETRWGEGYYMTKQMKALAESMIAEGVSTCAA